MNESSTAAQRVPLLQHALRLEYLTIGWNVVEGLVAVSAAALAGSIALLAFGIDSFVECASGLVLVWRLTAEGRGMDVEEIERLDQRAHKLVGASLFLLAAYVGVVAGLALWHGERPRPSIVGIVLTVLSIATMLWLARAKPPLPCRAARWKRTPSRRPRASCCRSSRSRASDSTRSSAGGGPTPWPRWG
jgi:hypothetical protein